MTFDAVQMNALRGGIFDQRLLIDVLRQKDRDMHAGVFALKRQSIPVDQRLHAFENEIMFAAVNLSHAVDMLFKISFAQEMREDCLIHAGDSAGIMSADLFVPFQKFRWKDHVADTDRRSDCFGKGTDINNTILVIHSLKGRNRLAAVTELTVVVIFDNVTVRSGFCPGKKLDTPTVWHDCAKRKLMGWCDIDDGTFRCN